MFLIYEMFSFLFRFQLYLFVCWTEMSRLQTTNVLTRYLYVCLYSLTRFCASWVSMFVSPVDSIQTLPRLFASVTPMFLKAPRHVTLSEVDMTLSIMHHTDKVNRIEMSIKFRICNRWSQTTMGLWNNYAWNTAFKLGVSFLDNGLLSVLILH